MVSDTQNSTLTQKLTGSGLRATSQREIVYQVLLDQRDHPSVDEVFSRVKTLMPTISLATVYNCLDALVGCGLVKQVNFERGASRYCPNLQDHAHFHDDATGRIVDIDLPADVMAKLRSILPPGYEAGAIELNFHGRVAP
jgi:Fur family peroxide stress response transcriptional regulator